MHTLGGRRRDATHSRQVFRTASRGTPEAVIETLNKAVRDALANPRLKQRFSNLGQVIPPAEQQTARWLSDFQKAEIDKWVPLMKAAKVKTE